MTLEEIIKEKDYDYIEFRMICEARKNGSIFYGAAKSVDGELISLDGDNYDEELNMEPVSKREFKNPDRHVEKGLTVIFDFLNNNDLGE